MRTITTVATWLNARHAPHHPKLPALLAMTDTRRWPDPSTAIPHLPPSSGLVYRNGDHPQRRSLALQIRPMCRRHHVPLFWAGQAADALSIGADGLHLRDLPRHQSRQIQMWRYRRGKAPIIAAAHSPRSLRWAVRLGADAVCLSPVFPTNTHPGSPCLGITRFRLWLRQASCPVYALGGITPTTMRQVLTTGCCGIAGIDWALSRSQT